MGHRRRGRIRSQRIECSRGRHRFVEAAHHHLDDVVDVGEIPLHPALVEHLDRLPGQDRPGEQHRRNVGPAPGSVHGEKAQAGGGQAIEVAVGVGHQLVGFLRGGIQADRMVHGVLFGERQLLVSAIHRTARRIHQMLDPVVAATLQDRKEAHYIPVHVGQRLLQRVAHPRLGGKMDHPVGPLDGVQLRDPFAIFEIELIEAKAILPLQSIKSGSFHNRIVVAVEVVEPNHLLATL